MVSMAHRATRPETGRSEGQQLRRVVGIGDKAHRQRDAVPVHRQVVLEAGFAPIHRVWPGPLARLMARTTMLWRLGRRKVDGRPEQDRNCAYPATVSIDQAKA
jgi:hypothetical protein